MRRLVGVTPSGDRSMGILFIVEEVDAVEPHDLVAYEVAQGRWAVRQFSEFNPHPPDRLYHVVGFRFIQVTE